MSALKFLIDTNVFIHLEDASAVPPTFAQLVQTASRNNVSIYVHEAAVDDISRDKDHARRRVSLSKLDKFLKLSKVRGLTPADLEVQFGRLQKPNDVVDATLLHALQIEVADFLITEDQGLHERVRSFAPNLVGRVLYVADALSFLRATYEPAAVSIPFVEEVDAHAIPLADPIFSSLRQDYVEFDDWWKKCIKELRKCWVVISERKFAGLVVRKTEQKGKTDASLPGDKVLKICTFKVDQEHRGIKLGELLLKQVLWFAQANSYDVVYLTTFSGQGALIDLIGYYGFRHTYTKPNGELVYEKPISRAPLEKPIDLSFFDAARLSYPRYYAGPEVSGFGVPIKEQFHEILFPELADRKQADLFSFSIGPSAPGNTIRKVYLCRARAQLIQPGDILLFYKGKSKGRPSQAITTIGIFEQMSLARSTEDLRRMAGGRSVYSESRLLGFAATENDPVKVINFLLMSHIAPVIEFVDLQRLGVFGEHPPQSIFKLKRDGLLAVLGDIKNAGFQILP